VLGARTAAALLAKAGHAVSLFNFPMFRKKGKPFPLPAGLGHLAGLVMPEEGGPVSFFTRYQHFGPTFAECARWDGGHVASDGVIFSRHRADRAAVQRLRTMIFVRNAGEFAGDLA